MVYTGKNTFQVYRTSSLSTTEQTCLAMMQGFEHNGYELYMDNYYTSPQLFSELKTCSIGAVGIVKHNRKYMPHDLQPAALVLNKGHELSGLDHLCKDGHKAGALSRLNSQRQHIPQECM